jgi:hypothetical protein
MAPGEYKSMEFNTNGELMTAEILAAKRQMQFSMNYLPDLRRLY